MADVFLNRAMVGCSVSVDIVDRNAKKVAQSPAYPIASDGTKVDFCTKGIKAWNAEQPNLYTAIFTLRDAAGKTIHIERQKWQKKYPTTAGYTLEKRKLNMNYCYTYFHINRNKTNINIGFILLFVPFYVLILLTSIETGTIFIAVFIVTMYRSMVFERKIF